MNVLELFAGTRSIGKAFEAAGHKVFSVEWDKRFENIDLYADILTVTTADIIEKFGKPDVIWASPDCTTYSVAAISKHRRKEANGNHHKDSHSSRYNTLHDFTVSFRSHRRNDARGAQSTK